MDYDLTGHKKTVTLCGESQYSNPKTNLKTPLPGNIQKLSVVARVLKKELVRKTSMTTGVICNQTLFYKEPLISVFE
jgi:hypothetical protein